MQEGEWVPLATPVPVTRKGFPRSPSADFCYISLTTAVLMQASSKGGYENKYLTLAASIVEAGKEKGV